MYTWGPSLKEKKKDWDSVCNFSVSSFDPCGHLDRNYLHIRQPSVSPFSSPTFFLGRRESVCLQSLSLSPSPSSPLNSSLPPLSQKKKLAANKLELDLSPPLLLFLREEVSLLVRYSDVEMVHFGSFYIEKDTKLVLKKYISLFFSRRRILITTLGVAGTTLYLPPIRQAPVISLQFIENPTNYSKPPRNKCIYCTYSGILKFYCNQHFSFGT